MPSEMNLIYMPRSSSTATLNTLDGVSYEVDLTNRVESPWALKISRYFFHAVECCASNANPRSENSMKTKLSGPMS